MRETGETPDDGDGVEQPAAESARPGGWGEKPTREELEVRIDAAAKIMARKLCKSDIKRHLKRLFNVSARTCERYMARARELRLIEWSGKTREEHRIESLALYESVIREATDAKTRMDAQDRIDRLLGLAAPVKSELTGKDGGAIPVSVIRIIEPPADAAGEGPDSGHEHADHPGSAPDQAAGSGGTGG